MFILLSAQRPEFPCYHFLPFCCAPTRSQSRCTLAAQQSSLRETLTQVIPLVLTSQKCTSQYMWCINAWSPELCKDPPPNVARLLTTLPSKPPLSVLAEVSANNLSLAFISVVLWCCRFHGFVECHVANCGQCEVVEKDMWSEAAEKEGVDQKWHMRTWFWWQFGKKL
jgi:hypothetical protein